MNNKLWADVLAYRPRIENKKRTVEYQEGNVTEDKVVISKPLIGYIKNNPLTTIVSLNNAISSLSYLLKDVKAMVEKYDSSYLNAKDKSKYINDNFSINGNSIFEVYETITNDIKLLNTLKNDFEDCYYGTSDIEEINEIEKEKIDLAIQYENDDPSKVNYSMISYDSYINSITSNFADDIVSLNNKMYLSSTVKRKVDIDGNLFAINTIFEDKYSNIEGKSKIRFKEVFSINNSNILENNLYGAFNMREMMQNAIEADSSIPKHNDDNYINIIMGMKDTYINKAFDVADDYIKSLLMYSVSKEEYNETLSEREGIKNILSK